MAKLILKRSSVAAKVPLAADLVPGELAVNLADAKLYTKTTGGVVIQLGASSTSATNLTLTQTTTSATVLSDTGTDATIPAATASLAGLMASADKTKLDGLAASATTDTTNASNISSGTLAAGRLSGSYSITAANATTSSNVASPDGSRLAGDRLPNTNPRNVRFDFSNSASAGTGGNYAGVMTYAPWDGTTASTGDASYQLAFGSTATNAAGIPQVNVRKGIDTTWNSWYTMLHSGNYNNYSPTLTGAGASGTWGVSISGNAATVTNGVYSNTSYIDPAFINSLAKAKVGLGNVENTALSTWAGSANITTLGTISSGTVPAARVSGLAASATTDTTNASNISSGTISAARLPSYVDDVLEYAGLASFPAVGETGKIYIAIDTSKTYRWSGSVYVYITSGAVDSVAGKTGVVALVKGDVGLGNVENTALSTWAGSANITTLGTIASGTVPVARVSGLASSATTDTTNAANISSGTLPSARLTGSYAISVTGSAASCTGNSANVTGTVALANGGTGGTTAASARTNLGATTAGSNIFTLANPSVTSFVRINADNTVTATAAIPQNAQTAAYTLVAADSGKHVSITTGGVTVPATVFAVGDAVTIFNNSATNQTITQGASVTLRLAGTATTGNRTLAQYGTCTLLCVASNVFAISGSGLT